MAESALRALDQAYMMGMGQGPAPVRVPKTRGQTTADVLGAASIPMSAVPIAGDITGLAADAAMYAAYPEERTMGNYAMSALGVLPLVPGVSALRAARGASPLEGTLDMSQAARMQRSDEGGYLPETYYHATSGDFYEFVPKYDDQLTFITPNKTFANNWLGKGGARSKLSSAQYDDPIYLEYKAETRKIWDKYAGQYGDDMALWPETEAQKYRQEKYKIMGLFDSIDQSIYPLRTNVQNTFDPRQHEDVIADYFRLKGRNPAASTISGDFNDMDTYKRGNYLLYENPEMVQFLKNKGFDSMRLAESTYDTAVEPTFDTLAVFNPANIRSVNAAFDPAKRGSSNILAGAAGGAIGLSALRGLQSDEQERKPD